LRGDVTSIDQQLAELEDLLTARAFFDDPYPIYRRMRSGQPVYWSNTFKSWLLTRHADVVAALRDPRLSGRRTSGFLDEQLPREWQPVVEPLRNQLTTFIGFSDPPQHTRLRRLVNKAFATGVVERMRPRIQRIVDTLIASMRQRSEVDLVSEFAFPLPAIVIAEALGVPAEDRHLFKSWADEFVPFITAGRLTLDVAQKAQHGIASLREYVLTIVARRRQQPGDDLMTGLIKAESEGDRLTEEEMLSMCITMLIGGHETTTNLIANGMLALLRNPTQRKALARDSSLILNAVEELLRYDAPLQRTFRIATTEMQLGDATVRKGQVVSMMLGAANRDPAIWTKPDELDLMRPADRHVGFGHGIHYCVGAPLARLEVEIAILSLVRAFPDMLLGSDNLEYQPTLGLRALKALPVTAA
jgi:cytochrome P450